jgi:hypothetical protein
MASIRKADRAAAGWPGFRYRASRAVALSSASRATCSEPQHAVPDGPAWDLLTGVTVNRRQPVAGRLRLRPAGLRAARLAIPAEPGSTPKLPLMAPSLDSYFRTTNVPRPGMVCTSPSSTRILMARRMVFGASPVSSVSSMIDGSSEVISREVIRARNWSATCTYGWSGEAGSIFTASS